MTLVERAELLTKNALRTLDRDVLYVALDAWQEAGYPDRAARLHVDFTVKRILPILEPFGRSLLRGPVRLVVSSPARPDAREVARVVAIVPRSRPATGPREAAFVTIAFLPANDVWIVRTSIRGRRGRVKTFESEPLEDDYEVLADVARRFGNRGARGVYEQLLYL